MKNSIVRKTTKITEERNREKIIVELHSRECDLLTLSFCQVWCQSANKLLQLHYVNAFTQDKELAQIPSNAINVLSLITPYLVYKAPQVCTGGICLKENKSDLTKLI